MWAEDARLLLKDVTLSRKRYYFIFLNTQKTNGQKGHFFNLVMYVWSYNLMTVLFFPEVELGK